MVSYLTTLFLGKSPEVNLPVYVSSAHFSPVTGSLLFLKQLIPKREIDFKHQSRTNGPINAPLTITQVKNKRH